MPLFGNNKELMFTMYSKDQKIIDSPKENEGAEFDIFTYKPTADTKRDANIPIWFSIGGFVKLEKGQVFVGAFTDKTDNATKWFIGKFMHAVFYTAKLLGADKASKTHNDIAVTFEVMNIGPNKSDIQNEFDKNTYASDNSTTKITEKNAGANIEKIKYCSVAVSKQKLVSVDQPELTVPIQEYDTTSENTPVLDSNTKTVEKKEEKYIISNLVISSDKGTMFGFGKIDADDAFLQSLVPTKPEEAKPGAATPEATADKPAAAAEAGTEPAATPASAPAAAAAPAAAPAAAEAGTSEEEGAGAAAKIQGGGRKRKTGKKRKSRRRRATKRKLRSKRYAFIYK